MADCPDCNENGWYVGLEGRERCQTCNPVPLTTMQRVVKTHCEASAELVDSLAEREEAVRRELRAKIFSPARTEPEDFDDEMTGVDDWEEDPGSTITFVDGSKVFLSGDERIRFVDSGHLFAYDYDTDTLIKK